MSDLPDIQQSEPIIKIPIKEVGVENVEGPFILDLKNGGYTSLTANISLRTNLDSQTKGISMSRLLLTLRPHLGFPLKSVLIKQILEELNENIGSRASFMKFEFKLPLRKTSIKTDHYFPLYYKCRFEGQLINTEFKFFQGVRIQYASYCPCSAELCGHLNENGSSGYPHNQRSFADILVEGTPGEYLWLEDIIENVESKIKTLPYPIIKRVDEQEIARVAAENPMFVEDAIRIISSVLNEMSVKDWIVKCSHEESIHTSEAIAVNWKGIPEGFNGNRFL